METALVYLVFTAVFVEVKCKGESEFVDNPWTPLVERFEEITKGIEDNNGKKGILEKVLIESIGSVVSKDCNDGLLKDIGGPYTTDVPEVFTKLYVLRHPRDQIEEQLYWILPSVECVPKIQQSSTAIQPSRLPPSVVPVPTQSTTNQSPTSNSQSLIKPGHPSGSRPPPPPPKPEYVIVENPDRGKVLGVVSSPIQPTPPKAKQPEKSSSVKPNPTITSLQSGQGPQRLREEEENRQRTLSGTRDVDRNNPIESQTDSAARDRGTSANSGFQEVIYPGRALLPVRRSKHATLRSRLSGRGS